MGMEGRRGGWECGGSERGEEAGGGGVGCGVIA